MADSESDARRTQIDEVVSAYVRRCSRGESVDRGQIAEQHPELMPELAHELAQRQLIAMARRNFQREQKPQVPADVGQRASDCPDANDPEAGSDPRASDDDALTQASRPSDRNQPPADGLQYAEHVLPSTSGLDDSIDTVQIAVRCPHCGNSVSILVDVPWSDITCIGCGNTFSLVADGMATQAAPALKTIAHFELIERIGVGGFGTVWKARDTILDRVVALKLPRHGKLSEAEVDKFLREARAAAQLRHPAIVSVHEVGRTDETVYIVSDLVRGVLLSEWAAIRSPSPHETAELMLQLSRALEHAHQMGVVHRDLKPGNIMVDRRNRPHIMDFGLAKRDAGEVTVTIEGQVLGTPAYMAPEQARGEAHLCSAQTDVYSMGVILFELLTGGLPFRGNTSMLVHQVLTEEPPKPRTLNNHIPVDLETICLRCLEKDPARRFADGGELADELNRFLTGEPIQSRPIGSATRALRWCRRNVTVTVMAVATVLTLILGTAVSTYFALVAGEYLTQSRESRREAEESRRAATVSRAQAKQSQQRAEKAQEKVGSVIAVADNFLSGGAKILSVPYNRQLQSVGLLLQDEGQQAARRSNALLALEMMEDVARCAPSMRDYAWRLLHRLARLRVENADATLPTPWSVQLEQPRRIEFSPDNSAMAVVTAEAIRVFDPESGHEKAVIPTSQTATDLAWSMNSQQLAYCQADGTTRVMNMRGGRSSWRVAEEHWARSLVFRGNGMLLIGTRDGRLLNATAIPRSAAAADRASNGAADDAHTDDAVDAENRSLSLMPVSPAPIADIDYKPTAFTAVATGKRVVVLSRNAEPRVLAGHTSNVIRIVVARNGSFVLSAGENGEVMRWRVASRRPTAPRQLCPPGTALQTIDVSADNKSIVTVLEDRVQVWDARTGEFRVALLLTDHLPLVTARFGPHPADETHCLAVIDAAQRLSFWNGEPAPREPTLYLGDEIHHLVSLKKPAVLVCAGNDRDLHCVELDRLDSRRQLFCPEPVKQLAAQDADDGAQYIAVVVQDGSLRVFHNAGKGEWLARIDLSRNNVASAHFSTDGRHLLCVQRDGSLWVVSLETSRAEKIAEPIRQIEMVAVLPNRLSFVSADASGELAIWRTNAKPSGDATGSWQITGQIGNPTGNTIRDLAVLDSHRIAILLETGQLAIGDTQNGRWEMAIAASDVSCIASHPASGRLATASGQTISIWQLNDDGLQRLGRPRTDHRRPILAVTFTQDGNQLIASATDRSVKIFDLD